MKSERNIVIKQLRNGQKSDFRRLFNQYYGRLVLFANTFLQNHQESEDIVQNIFIHLWENAKGIDFSDSLQAYLYRAVRNRCLNKLRDKNIRDRHNLLYLEALIAHLKTEKGVELPLENELKKALVDLPDQVKTILEQKYFHNKKIREIAEDLGVSNNTVKTQLQRGKKKLKNALGINTSKLILLLLTLSEL